MPFSSNSICVRLAYALLGLFIAGCIGAAVAIAIFFAAHKTSSPANGKIENCSHDESRHAIISITRYIGLLTV
jgi:hypothetical protein